MPESVPLRARLATLARSALAGGAATLADLAVLVALVSIAHVDPRAANWPALLVGGVINFLGNRSFAFRATGGPLAKHAILYTLVEIVALALNGILYDAAMRAMPGATHLYWAVRLVTSNVVFLAWSYPLWRRVFSARRSREIANGAV